MLSAPLLLAALIGADPTESPLWGDKIPGPTSKDPKNVPTLTYWPPPTDKANHTAVVVCPGGGNGGRAPDQEAKQTAGCPTPRGPPPFTLKPRPANESKTAPPLEPGPMLDVQRAIRTVR